MTYFTTGAQLQAALNALPNTKTGNFVAFDSFFYGQQYMADYQGTLSPIEHFVQIGAARGYKPNATFDPTYYKNAFADLKNTDFNAADLLYHFMQYGLDEGRTPNAALATFDGTAYLAANPDVAAYVNANLAQFGGSATNGALAHYVKFGAAEGRTAPGTSVSNGQTFTLTTGIDTLAGTAGNDTFNAPVSDGGTPTQTLGGLDSIDGGAGTDTLKVDFGTAAAKLPATATIKNIEVISASTSGNSGVDMDVTGIAGVQQLDIANAGTGASSVKGAQVVNVTGGGAATVTGTGLTSVTLTKVSVDSTGYVAGNTPLTSSIAINNTVASGANTGTTLTSVTLDNVKDSAATAVPNGVLAALNGDGIAEVTVKNQSVNLTATITNAVSTALKVNVDNAGYDAAGTAVAGVVVNAGAKAEAITVNATGSKSNVTVNAAAAKTLSLTGSADLKLAGVSGAPLTSIDGSAATGGLDLGTLNAGTATVTTGSGADKFTISATKVTVDAGAGNDTVTLGSTIAVGSSIKLGAGDDVLLSSSGALAAKDATGTAVIDGGDGIDTVAASLINATNATQFVNCERIDASAGTTNLDVDLMTGSTIGGLTLNGGTGTVTIQNLAVGAGLTVAGANTGSLVIGVKGAATNTADTFGITFAGKAGSSATAASPDAVSATDVGLQGVEAVTVNSGGTGFVANVLSLAGNTSLKTVTITGDKALDLSFTAANGTTGATTGVSSIDGSAATGKLTVDLANVNGVTAGVTVKGGSADDEITTSTVSATLTGGAGKDKFIATAAVAGGTTVATAKMTTITDFTAGDTITGLTTISNANEIGKIALTSTVQNLDQAFALLGDNTSNGTNKDVQWFNYGSDTYVVFNDNSAGLSAGDVVVKLIGTIDLSNATVTTGGVLTLA